MTAALRSPVSGASLEPDTPHSLAAPGERWPVVDAIPYLRTGRADLVRDTLACLDAGERDGALTLLLADQDDWWDGPAPPGADLRRLVRERDALTLRDAMSLLGYGRVGDYFAHRWSDPTFLAGLALVEAHWTEPATAFELACGIGHHLGELLRAGLQVSGVDVVFSKLWLARHWVLGPMARLVCFDAAAPWPVTGERADLVLCQDAFYFLEPKAEILAGLRRIAGDGVVVLGHVHNREAENMSAGAGVTAAEIEALAPDALVYDDAELTDAAVTGRAPRPEPPAALRGVEAFSVVAGRGRPAAPLPVAGRLTCPEAARWRLNPLYVPTGDGEVELAWPSERYRREYAPRATYPERTRLLGEDGERVPPEAMRRREFVPLPERW